MASKASAERSMQQVTQSPSSVVGAFTVKSGNNKTTQDVFMGNDTILPQCPCHEFQKTKWPCKHFFGVFKNFPEWTFDSLPVEDIFNPFISLDGRILSPIKQHADETGYSFDNSANTINQPSVVPLVQEITEHLNHQSPCFPETLHHIENSDFWQSR